MLRPFKRRKIFPLRPSILISNEVLINIHIHLFKCDTRCSFERGQLPRPLCLDPNKRATIQEAWKSTWLVRNGCNLIFCPFPQSSQTSLPFPIPSPPRAQAIDAPCSSLQMLLNRRSSTSAFERCWPKRGCWRSWLGFGSERLTYRWNPPFANRCRPSTCSTSTWASYPRANSYWTRHAPRWSSFDFEYPKLDQNAWREEWCNIPWEGPILKMVHQRLGRLLYSNQAIGVSILLTLEAYIQSSRLQEVNPWCSAFRDRSSTRWQSMKIRYFLPWTVCGCWSWYPICDASYKRWHSPRVVSAFC